MGPAPRSASNCSDPNVGIDWPVHSCLVCSQPAECLDGAPIFRWRYRCGQVTEGPAICIKCRFATAALGGQATLTRVRRLRGVPA